MKIIYLILLIPILSSCSHRPSAARVEIINVDIAAISYSLSSFIAIYPTEVFTRADASLTSVNHAALASKSFFDSLETLLPPKVKYDEDYFVNRPYDARIVCLLTNSDHTIDILWFGGPYTVYRDEIYEFDSALASLVSSKLSGAEKEAFLDYLHGE